MFKFKNVHEISQSTYVDNAAEDLLSEHFTKPLPSTSVINFEDLSRI